MKTYNIRSLPAARPLPDEAATRTIKAATRIIVDFLRCIVIPPAQSDFSLPSNRCRPAGIAKRVFRSTNYEILYRAAAPGMTTALRVSEGRAPCLPVLASHFLAGRYPLPAALLINPIASVLAAGPPSPR